MQKIENRGGCYGFLYRSDGINSADCMYSDCPDILKDYIRLGGKKTTVNKKQKDDCLRSTPK